MKLTATLTLVVLAALAILDCGAVAGHVTGTFRLEQKEYCVGEPILVEFSVTNAAETDYLFSVGGDYRGTLRHERFSFRVSNGTGKPFNAKVWGNLGGMGSTITLKPGETYIEYQLLSSWVHLLPPGKYSVRCERRLTLGFLDQTRNQQPHAPVTIGAELTLRVVQYDRKRITESVREMKRTERIRSDRVRHFWVGKPVGWALSDISKKFQLGVTSQGDDNQFMATVLKALPERWDDRYYLEYGLRSNRNWLTMNTPEEYRLTFSVRNNSASTLPHGLTNSTLSVAGVSVPEWPTVLRDMMKATGIGGTVQSAETLEISGTFNKFLQPGITQQVVWTIGEVTQSTKVLFRD